MTALPCSFEDDEAADAPRVLALPVGAVAGAPEATRQAARQHARQVLAAALAETLACDARDIVLSSQRGQAPRAAWRAGAPRDPQRATWLASAGLSISHAPGLSLAAWRAGGAVGVDVQAALGPSELSADEMQRVARLYLGPASGLDTPGPRAQMGRAALTNAAFVARWAAHEARLKCLGEPLQEWHPALADQLASCQARRLVLPPALLGGGASGCVAAVAWRDAAS